MNVASDVSGPPVLSDLFLATLFPLSNPLLLLCLLPATVLTPNTEQGPLGSTLDKTFTTTS